MTADFCLNKLGVSATTNLIVSKRGMDKREYV